MSEMMTVVPRVAPEPMGEAPRGPMSEMMTVVPRVAPEPMGEAPRGGGMLTTASLFRIIQEHIYERFFSSDVGVEDLLADDPILDAEGKETRHKRARFELRYRKFALSENGLIGKEGVTEKHFRYHNVGIPVHSMRKDLMSEQPALDWWIVGLIVEKKRVDMPSETFRDVIDARSLGGRTFGEAMPNLNQASFANQDPENTQAVSAMPSSVPRIIEVPDYHYVVHLAWADISGNEMQDTVTQHHEREGAAPSSMADYAETRNLRFLTPGAQKNRRRAQEVIRQWSAEQRKLAGAPVASLPLPTPPAAPQPKAAPAQGPDRLESLVPRVLEMRARGTPSVAISRSLKISMEEVKAILEAAANGTTP